MICYFYAELFFRFHYYCITMCVPRIFNINRGKNIQGNSNRYSIRRWIIDIYLLRFFVPVCQYNIAFLCMLTFCFVFIVLVLQYFRRVSLQKFTHHRNTTTAATKKSVDTVFFILFTLLSNNIS